MTELEWLEIFGDNLRDMMRGFGINQKELAEETGISQSTISKYINKQQMPGPKALLNIADALDCKLEDLMDFGDIID